MSISVPLASLGRRISSWLSDEIGPENLLSSLNSGLLLFLLETIMTLSILALVFSGELAAHIPTVIGWMLLGNALLVATVSLLSSYSGSIAMPQDAPAVIVAAATASLVAGVQGGSEQLFATAALLLAGATLALGVVYLLIGGFKLGSLARFIPYPVIAGFLAATGWLLLIGGLGVAVGVPFGPAWLQPDVLLHWLPALLLGIVLWWSGRRWNNPLVMVGLFVLAGLAFYAGMLLRGVSFAQISAEGWLVGPFLDDPGIRRPPLYDALAIADRTALLNAVPIAIPAVLVSTLAMLLNASSLELIVKRDIDPNRELLAVGTANVLASLVGGLMGYHAISLSTLNYRVGKGKRLPGLLSAALMVLIALAGTALLSYIPRFVLGGLLVFVGSGLLYDYLLTAWLRFSKPDLVVIVSIFVIVALEGFLWGVGLGLVLAVLLFVVNYSRIDIVRYELSGETFHSRVSRGLRQTALLAGHGQQLVIYKLQGFIFFGTANNLFKRVRARVLASKEPVRFVLLDFAQVSGLDSTGLLAFGRLFDFTRELGAELLLTGASARVGELFARSELGRHTAGLRFFDSIDRGVEWCEEQFLAGQGGQAFAAEPFESQLPVGLASAPLLAELLRSMQRREVAAGELLIRQGDRSDELFFVESGQLTARLDQEGREPVRLETMQGGRVVGEVGFFLDTPRTASVVADRPTVLYVLGRAQWIELGQTRPELAQALSGLVLYLMGSRVAHLTRVVEALQD